MTTDWARTTLTTEQKLMTDYAQFATPEAFNEWLDEQDDRDDALDDAWDAYFEDETNPVDQRKPWRWLIPAVDPDRTAYQFPEELREKQFDMHDENDDGGHEAVMNFILESFKELTGLEPTMTGDLQFDWDSDDRISSVVAGVIHAVPDGYEDAVMFDIGIDWQDEDEMLTFTYEES